MKHGFKEKRFRLRKGGFEGGRRREGQRAGGGGERPQPEDRRPQGGAEQREEVPAAAVPEAEGGRRAPTWFRGFSVAPVRPAGRH